MSESENTRQEAYERVRRFIMSNTTGHPTQKAVKEQQLKLSLVAHGDLEVSEVNTALKALGEQEVIQYGSGWITPVVSESWHRDAVSYVVEQSGGDCQEFVSVANRAIQAGELGGVPYE